ncbi:unnamed protein product [Lactuca virosa]|uniref:F-box associated beta-propeller type 1 domain-containing protein n=1 Tax=Lactuca virosa TaxID=75947 RepID=A0AAU9P388_9ASTR|nr:unnamed protein product [Lactuca virosa]
MIYRNSEEEMTGGFETGILKWVEVEDELDHHRLHHDPVMSLDLNLAPIFQESQIHPVGSVDGLLCLWQLGKGKDNTYICNPITREYMILPRQQYYIERDSTSVYCFGVSSLTREYKVIRIFQKLIPPDFISTFQVILSQSEAEVYTLGTGQWRSLGHVPYWISTCSGPYLNGHAHWTLVGNDFPEKICAFDFDKETFELFPSPPYEAIEESFGGTLGVLKGCLCRCDTYDSNMTVWVMKEYGIKNSWHKELVIKYIIKPDFDMLGLEPNFLIEGFKDGTFLMANNESNLIVYCPRRKTVVDREVFGGYFNGLPYRPSFHRLHNFKNERVHVF